jgi:hypothetical protein
MQEQCTGSGKRWTDKGACPTCSQGWRQLGTAKTKAPRQSRTTGEFLGKVPQHETVEQSTVTVKHETHKPATLQRGDAVTWNGKTGEVMSVKFSARKSAWFIEFRDEHSMVWVVAETEVSKR